MRSARALEVYEKINCQFVYIDYIAKISPICKYYYINRLSCVTNTSSGGARNWLLIMRFKEVTHTPLIKMKQ